MRIVGGRWRGRALTPPPDERIRPTSDKVREAWFSILGSAIPGARVVDLFAGSGALGLEALSRGAASAHLVELAPASLRVLDENVARLGAGDLVTVRRGDAVQFAAGLAAGSYDVALADPPYALGLAAQVAELWVSTPFAARLCVEHESGAEMPPGGQPRRYGGTTVTFYRIAADFGLRTAD